MISFPEGAKVGRIIAKEKFYSKTDTATKNLFQSEVARITWEYKLAPETINLPAKHWPEIEVFRITLKNYDLPSKVLKIIDSAIPYPILFFVEKGTAKKAVICYKEQNQKNENTAKVDTYFETEWNDERLNNIKIDGLDIDSVFSNFVRQIAGERYTSIKTVDNNTPTTIEDDVKRIKDREKILKQIESLTHQIKSEPSIGKKQLLAEERYKLKQLLG